MVRIHNISCVDVWNMITTGFVKTSRKRWLVQRKKSSNNFKGKYFREIFGEVLPNCKSFGKHLPKLDLLKLYVVKNLANCCLHFVDLMVYRHGQKYLKGGFYLPWVRNLVPPHYFQEQNLDTWPLTKP